MFFGIIVTAFFIPVIFNFIVTAPNYGELDILYSALVPIIVYENAETHKYKILEENKEKTAIYMWKHNESGKFYIDSAFDLSKRLTDYFSKYFLNRSKSSYIYNALLEHGYSKFSLSILEILDISGLSKEEARLKILEREQYYLDLIFEDDEPNTYNLLKTAGSLLGFKHKAETLAKMGGENHPMYGKVHKAETITKMTGRTLSAETKARMSKAKIADNHPKGMLGKTHTAETRSKISLAFNKKVWVYSFDSISNERILFKYFNSCTEAALFFNCSTRNISNYLDKNKLYKNKWILSSSLIS